MKTGNQYRHLTERDRIFLHKMLKMHYAKSKIAMILGVHRSTIYREIKRNGFETLCRSRKVQEYFSIVGSNYISGPKPS